MPSSRAFGTAVASVGLNLAVGKSELTRATETSFYDIQSNNALFKDALREMKASDFIAWDASFFNLIGPEAKLERIQSFVGQPAHVHEAPAYVPETNELFFADTSEIGWLWAINVDTYQVRHFTLELCIESFS